MEEIQLALKKVQCVAIYSNERASGSMETGNVFTISTFTILCHLDKFIFVYTTYLQAILRKLEVN
jgi:hypothetical protein